MLIVTFKLTPILSTKLFKFNKFVDLTRNVLLTNRDNLSRKYNDSPFTDENHKHVVNEDLRVIKNNIFKKKFY